MLDEFAIPVKDDRGDIAVAPRSRVRPIRTAQTAFPPLLEPSFWYPSKGQANPAAGFAGYL